MKMKEAMDIINNNIPPKDKGFMVSYEYRTRNLLVGDHFPDTHGGEKLIKSEEEAWKLAEKFAKATGNEYINIYVIDQNFHPVKDYHKRTFKKYPPL